MFDAVFVAKDPAYVDVIVEVKYLRSGVRISQAMSQLAFYAREYSIATGRDVDPLLIGVIAVPDPGPEHEHVGHEARQRLREAGAALGDAIKVVVLQEYELDELEPDRFHARLPDRIGQRKDTPP